MRYIRAVALILVTLPTPAQTPSMQESFRSLHNSFKRVSRQYEVMAKINDLNVDSVKALVDMTGELAALRNEQVNDIMRPHLETVLKLQHQIVSLSAKELKR